MIISVCIPTFNQGSYIKDAIESCVRQTRPPDEIIVTDDCSTDETSDVLKSLASVYPTLKLFRNTENLGISKNVDRALRLATGEYIVRLDSDDLLLPNYIETLFDVLNQNENCGYAHCAIQEIDQTGHYLQKRFLHRSSGFQNSNEALMAAIKGYKVAANIIIFRRKALEEANYIQCPINFAEDFFLSASIADKGWGNVYIPSILACYRVWTDKKMLRKKRKLDEINGFKSVYQLVLEPAFKSRKWDISIINQQKANIASDQADCLALPYYSKEEKEELKSSLLALSDSKKVKRIIRLYELGFGKYINLKKNINYKIKKLIKKALKK